MTDKKDDLKLKRKYQHEVKTEVNKEEPEPVSAGPIIKFLDLVFNASDDKIREVTVIDRRQGRLLPQQDIINTTWGYLIEVAAYRKDNEEYKRIYEREYPVEPNLGKEFIKRTAQWQKSINGLNLGKAVDIALAEMETKIEEDEEDSGATDPFRE